MINFLVDSSKSRVMKGLQASVNFLLQSASAIIKVRNGVEDGTPNVILSHNCNNKFKRLLKHI